MDNEKLFQESLKRLEERGLYLDENGLPQRKNNHALIDHWVGQNFPFVFNYGMHKLIFTDKEEKETRKIFKKTKQIENLNEIDRKLFFIAFASLICNLKIHLRLLKENVPDLIKKGRKLKDGQQLHEIFIDDEIDPIAELAMQDPGVEYDWSKDPIIEKKIRIYKGSKKKPEVDDEELSDAAKIISKKLNKFAGVKKGIPDFACNVAYQVDFWLKRFFPGIKTNAIIRDLFSTLQFSPYDDIAQIDNLIKRGKKAAQK